MADVELPSLETIFKETPKLGEPLIARILLRQIESGYLGGGDWTGHMVNTVFSSVGGYVEAWGRGYTENLVPERLETITTNALDQIIKSPKANVGKFYGLIPVDVDKVREILADNEAPNSDDWGEGILEKFQTPE